MLLERGGRKIMEWMNPVEWFAWIYGKVFQGHEYVGGTIVVFSFAAFGLLLWVRGVDKYREDKKKIEASTSAAVSGPIGIVVKDNGKYEGIGTSINGVQEGIRVEGSGQAKTYGLEISDPNHPSKPRTVQEQINSFIISSDEARKSKFDLDGWTAVVSNFLDQAIGSKESKEFMEQPTLEKKVEFLKKLKK